MFTGSNRYDDTTFLVYSGERGAQVLQSRATVDPGGESDIEFQVAADQQWDYEGNARGTSAKYDRPLYALAEDGAAEVQLGTYWRRHPEEVEAAIGRVSRGQPGRIIRRPDGRTETDRADLIPRGETTRRPSQRVVSAVHSGGRGRDTGEMTGGDSTGCTVVHGAWFAHFNEILRAAAGRDRVRFTYSMIDPRTYTQLELDRILDTVVPRERTAEAQAAPGEEPQRRIHYIGPMPRAGAPTVQPDGIQRVDFNADGTDDGPARGEGAICALVENILAAIAQNEKWAASMERRDRISSIASQVLLRGIVPLAVGLGSREWLRSERDYGGRPSCCSRLSHA